MEPELMSLVMLKVFKCKFLINIAFYFSFLSFLSILWNVITCIIEKSSLDYYSEAFLSLSVLHL